MMCHLFIKVKTVYTYQTSVSDTLFIHYLPQMIKSLKIRKIHMLNVIEYFWLDLFNVFIRHLHLEVN